MTLRAAACQYLVYLHACHLSIYHYQSSARVLQHFLCYAGDRPLSQVREGHMQRYIALVLSEQSLVDLQETRLRFNVSQSFWKWLRINHLVR